MVLLPAILALLFPSATGPAGGPSVRAVDSDVHSVADEVVEMHRISGLEGRLSLDVFRSAVERACSWAPDARVLAIADMSRPSTEERLVVFNP